MDGSGGSTGLAKLLPKAMTAKRRRRKGINGRDAEASAQDDDARSTSASSRSRRLDRRELTLESDDTSSIHVAEDDDVDGRSFVSHESGAADRDLTDASRPASSSFPSRPATISAHPSLIGYLTTSSPVVQAQHFDSQSHFRSPPPPLPDSDKLPSPHRATKSAEGVLVPSHYQQIPGPPAPAKIAPAEPNVRASRPKVQTAVPKTPPRDDSSAPVIVNTPPTPTDPNEYPQFAGSPTSKSLGRDGSPKAGADGSPAAFAFNMNVHRRTRSGSAVIGPSKLSHITTAPLTPTGEASGEPTPNATGFFSSMLSAAQNAANSISNTIPSTGLGLGGNKSRISLAKSQSSPAASQAALVDVGEMEPEPRIEDTKDRRESAVRTLGSGELSLSQLGLSEAPLSSTGSARFSDVVDPRIRADSAPTEVHAIAAAVVPAEPASRPRSLVDTASGGDKTPPQLEPAEIRATVHRSSSLRSAMKSHRKRGGSGTTTGTIATAVASASYTALQPSGGLGAPKLTGFAIASKKRNRDFHNLFKSVPDDDYLIEDYSCALQREILAHGRLYVSEGHLCFSSNILGWTTTLVMSFDEIVSVEKRSTALVFKNGLMISTLHAKHIFASFTSRDATYDLIVNIWKLGHPTLKSTLNGVQLEGTGGDKTEKVVTEQEAAEEEEAQDASVSDEQSDGDDEEFYDEEEHEEHGEAQPTDVAAAEPDQDKSVSRKVSARTTLSGPPVDLPTDATLPSSASPDVFPGPAAHAATDCGDAAAHYDKILGDDVIPAPLGKVYNLTFGPGSAAWMGKWLSGDQKCTDIQMEDKKGLTTDIKSRTFSYIKPLNGSIGPKQTKCIVTETVEQMDLEKAVNISVSTQNPDVPFGNLFTTKTKYCLSWAENNSTRIQMNCTVEWSGKCWIKGTIEKNANEGQGRYCDDLFASLKLAVSTRARPSSVMMGTVKGKKKLKRSRALQAVHDSEKDKSSKPGGRQQDWGPLEPVRNVLEPIVDVLQPLLTGNMMYGLLVGLLVAMWFGFGSSPKNSPSYGPEGGLYSPGRQAAYEEMWRRQDSELWEWLEERVGMDRLNNDEQAGARQPRAIEHRTVEEKLRAERMQRREVQEAIRVTEEKLRVLREVADKGNLT